MSPLPRSDGRVTIRPPEPGDADRIVAGRDEVFRQFMGDGDPEPSPTACIVVDGELVGWVDFDHERDWLQPHEVNLGYHVFADHRGHGYATRAVELLLQHLCEDTDYTTATLLIRKDNERSLALADRARFTPHGEMGRSRYFKRDV